jgi:hypothetical protein
MEANSAYGGLTDFRKSMCLLPSKTETMQLYVFAIIHNIC